VRILRRQRHAVKRGFSRPAVRIPAQVCASPRSGASHGGAVAR